MHGSDVLRNKQCTSLLLGDWCMRWGVYAFPSALMCFCEDAIVNSFRRFERISVHETPTDVLDEKRVNLHLVWFNYSNLVFK